MKADLPDAPATTPELAAALHRLRQDRLRSVLHWVWLGLLVLAVVYAMLGRPVVVTILLAAVALLAGAYGLMRQDRVTAAADWMLWVLTAMAGVLALVGQGLRDTALLAFPGLLVFAGMFWRRRTLFGLLGAQVLMAALIWLANAQGWYTSRFERAGVSQVLDIGLILGLTALAVWFLSEDLRQYFRQMRADNQRVRDSLADLEFSTRHDVLTGLPNRRDARDTLQRLTQDRQGSPRALAVVLINLDNFKTINDSLGPQLGDDFLLALAQRLKGLQAPQEQLFRVGGDEFLLLLDQTGEREATLGRVRTWMAAVEQPIVLGGVEIRITASAGMASYPADGSSYTELLQRVDLAMQRAKAAGRNTLRLFDRDMGGDEADHLQLLADMRATLASGGFALHYQPKVDLATGAVVGAEALLRWPHPERGWVPPAVFIPLAERSGLIVDLGLWVLREACRQAGVWQREGWVGLQVAVNVSMVQFRRGDLPQRVRQALDEAGLPGAALELELTESLFADAIDEVEATLRELRTTGVALAIDDFGTGYSNLGYLKRFEIQTLKIDQSFVRRMADPTEDRALVGAIIHMAQQLGLHTVAEGVETEAIAQDLRALGCSYGQGYWWARPLPPDEFHARLGPAAAVTERS